MNTAPAPESKKKQIKPKAKPKASKDEEPKKASAQQIRYSSIVRDGPSIPTIVGPIDGWKACVENLPNHPTMAFFGKRRTGKSTTITNILFHCCQKIPFGK